MYSMSKLSNISISIGRVLLGGAFLFSGVGSLLGFEGFVAATSSVPMLAIAPAFFAACAIFIKIVCGGLLLLGLFARYAAVALIVFTVLATFLFHFDFSNQTQIVAFVKNIMVLGGLFAFAGCSCGTYTVCRMFNKKQ